MSFSGELKGFSKGFSRGVDTWAKIEDIRKNRKWRESEVSGGNEFPAAPVPQTPQADDGKPAEGGKVDAASDVRWKQASPEQRALLNTIAGTESPGYNVVYGGGTFDGYGAHPGRDVPIESGPNKGKTSSAAGRYQFLGSTWNQIAKNYHLEDFSPENQDKAAWYLATEAYGRETGRDLNTDIKSKDPAVIASIGKALSGTWTSLPSGIEQGQTADKFVTSFNSFLGKAAGSESAEADTTGGAAGGDTGGALPEENEDDPIKEEAAAADTSDQEASLRRGSQDLQLEMNPIVAANYETPQVETRFDLDVGGLSPPRDDEVRPQMFAAKGGAIPEPTAFMQAGGVNPSGTPDPYNPARGYTQPIAKPAASTFAPRRISAPAPRAAATPGAVSSSVQKFRDIRSQQAAAEAARQAAAAQAAQQPVQGDWQTAMKNQQMADRMRTAAMGTRTAANWGHNATGGPSNPRAVAAYNDYARQVQAAQKQARASGQDPWMAQQMVDPSAARKKYGFSRFKQGGIIPDSDEAEEEAPRTRMDSVWEEEEAPRTRMDSVWPQTRGAVVEEGEDEENFARGGKVDPNRARARQRGEVYEASRDHEYWQQRQPRPQTERARSAGYAPTSVAGAERERRPAQGSPGEQPRKSSPAKKSAPAKKESKPAEKKADEKKPQPSGSPLAEEMADRDRPRPDRDMGPSPLAEEMADRDRPRGGALPEPEAPVVPDDRATREPGPDQAVTETDSGWRKRRVTPPVPAEPAVPEPPAAPLPAIVGRPPPPESVRPFQELPDTTLPPGSTATPAAEVQGPPAEAATPGPAWIGGHSVQPPGSPGPQLPEQGVWINGQFVPLASLQGGGNFARGGVVPEEDEEPISPRAESANYTTSAPASAATRGRPAPTAAPTEESAPAPAAEGEERPRAQLTPTPKLMADVGTALKGGARYLQRVFGLDGAQAGAVPTPEDGAAREQGIKRFATHEGAATPDEIREIDDQIDPKRELTEGDRQMTRMAKITQFYLERGRKDEAEAAAASLMQYGAKRFGQLGTLAQAAYAQYEKTQDPQHLERATQILSQAYGLIPDGGSMSITTDPETGKFQAVRINAQGEEETYDVSADQIPGLIRQTMDGSAYWQQIFRLGDPEGAKSKDVDRREQARQDRLDQRTAETRQAQQDEWNRRHEILREEKVGDVGAKTAADAAESDRRAARDADRRMEDWKAQHPDKSGEFEKIRQPFAEADKLRRDIEVAQKEDSDYLDSEEGVAAKAAYSTKVSQLYDLLPMDPKDRMDWMAENGFDPDTWDYVTPETSGPAGPATPKPGDPPPEPGAELKKDRDTGKPRWAIKKDGVWVWVPEPEPV